MKYLNLQAFREELERLGQSLVETKNASRWKAMDAHNELERCQASGEAAEASTALRSYRHVLELLDKHTFDLSNSWGRHACYMEGEEPPLAPCNHLSAKAQVLVETEDRVSPPENRVRLLALLTLATVKCFDDWLEEYQADYDHDPEAEGIAREIATQFHRLFGRPGFLQDVPDWMRQAFAWSYPIEEDYNDQ